MEDIHISGWMLTLAGTCVGILLTIIAFFLSRLVKQFDKLTEQVGVLNNTMTRIDKDLSGDVMVLKEKDTVLYQKLEDLEPMWDRMRVLENDVTAIKNGGCMHITRCEQ